jgi:hypothetical protein
MLTLAAPWRVGRAMLLAVVPRADGPWPQRVARYALSQVRLVLQHAMRSTDARDHRVHSWDQLATFKVSQMKLYGSQTLQLMLCRHYRATAADRAPHTCTPVCM